MRLPTILRGILVALLIGVGATDILAVNDHKSEYLHNATATTASASALNGTALDTTGYTSLGLQVVITDTATVSFQGTVDNSNWVATGCVATSDTSTATVTSTTASKLYQCNVAGLSQFRAPISGLTAGTVTVKGRLTTGPWSKRGGGGSTAHDLLDGSVAQDTVAAAVSRGSLVYGNATPKWDELVIGVANRVLTSDGTDAAWGQVVSAMLNITTTTCTNQFVTALSATVAGTCTSATLASAQYANQGTTVTLLHGNAAGNPSWAAVVSADLNITTTSCTNQFVTAISSGAVGTCSTVTLAGAQFANQGTTTTLLHGNAAGNPSWTAIVSADLNLTTTTCTNQFVSALSAAAAGTCTTSTLAGAQHANQGTTTTVLHGNGAGNPSWAAVSLTADVSGILPTANGGTGIAYFTAAGPTVARVYTFPDAAATVLTSNAAVTIAQGGTNATSFTGSRCIESNAGGTAFVVAAAACGTGGGASLDAITAAVADQSGILNADWNIVWKWAKVTDSEVAFNFTESAAATGGTSTAGVPNQVLLKLNTLAASTMSPLCVYSRALHIFCVAPTTQQMLFADGTVEKPIIARAAGITTGIYFSASAINMATISGNPNYSQPRFVTSGTGNITQLVLDGSPNLATELSLAFSGTANGFFSTNAVFGMGFASVEQLRWTAGVSQYSYGSADAVAYAINFRKARGTVVAPTVITTGDDLATISGYGYVGATNTYQEAAKILMDSTGTISDSATGIAGIIRFYTAATGAEPVEKWTMDNTGNLLSAGVVQASLGTPADGSIIYCSDCTIANPCAGAGTGAIAKRLNATWVCN